MIRVYHVSVDKKTGKTSMTQIKSNKVQLRTDAGGRVDINLTLLTRFVIPRRLHPSVIRTPLSFSGFGRKTQRKISALW